MRAFGTVLLGVGLAVGLSGCKKKPPEPAAPTTTPAPLPSSGADPTAAAKGKAAGNFGTFTVGKATTFVTGPTDATGHIDYAAALNDRLSKGVAAADNANAAIWAVLGPGTVSLPPAFFQRLGIAPPPAAGDYFAPIRQYAQRVAPGAADAHTATLGKFTTRPWAANEDAVLSGWLAANEKPLAAVVEATKRPGFYNPLVPEQDATGPKWLTTVLLPGVEKCRELASALTARAMLRLTQNRPDAAWQDLLACHRLGRLVGRGGTLIEGLVGCVIEQVACRGEVAYLDHAKPDAAGIDACVRDLQALPPPPAVADKVDGCERMMFLDAVMLLDRRGIAGLQGPGAEVPAGVTDELLRGIDWDPALLAANRWHDRLAAALREPDRSARVAKLGPISAETKALADRAADPGRLTRLVQAGVPPAKARGEVVGDMLLRTLLPSVNKLQDATDRTAQTCDNVLTAFACARYQRQNGKYPTSLDALVPTYLPAVPLDRFTGRPLRYAGGGTECAFYSLGVNGADDGGDNTAPRDDIGVRLPVRHQP